jgi:hypothetical protein
MATFRGKGRVSCADAHLYRASIKHRMNEKDKRDFMYSIDFMRTKVKHFIHLKTSMHTLKPKMNR